MRTLMTVQGPLPPEALGHCQMHEHIYVGPTPAARVYPALRIDDAARSLRELRAYRGAGGASLLDAQPLGAGRNIAALACLSRESGVNIVAVTGYHLPDFYSPDHWIFSEDPAALRERFCAELLEGVDCDGARIRPGAVKAAISAEGPVGRLGACLRAAAGAAARADVPLILHTERGAGAAEAVDICAAEGLSPSRIAVCHADRQAKDFSVHEAIARTGAFLEYDTIARYKYHDDAAEMRLILHMLERGCAGRLLFSLDTTAARLRSYGDPAAPGLDFILQTFLPMLVAAGVPRETIRDITVRNPLRIFGLDECAASPLTDSAAEHP